MDDLSSNIPVVEAKAVQNLNHLTNLVGQSITNDQFDQILYAVVLAANLHKPIVDKLEIAALVDATMSNFMRVHHPKLDAGDPTMMSWKFSGFQCV